MPVYSTSNERSIKRAKREYQLLSPTDVQSEMDHLADECASILDDQSPAHCKLLLRHVKWQKMVLLERFFDSPSNFLRQVGLGTAVSSRTSSSGNKLCGICLETINIPLGLPCDHKFCAECWTNYLVQKVLFDGIAYMSCPQRNCNRAVVEDFAKPLLAKNSPTAVETFIRLQLNSFVDSNPLIKWCPAANCSRAVKVENDGPSKIRCDCGFAFCFRCSHQWHAPVSCSLLRIWLKQCSDDTETYHWIYAFTKDCPKCKTAIEKNGGCNHMTCRSTACKHEFCWVCLGDWKEHAGNYSCNRFNGDDKKKEKAEESRAALKRYLHYFDRFRNHENSLKLEHKLYERVATMIGRFKSAKFRHIETEFLAGAVDVLCESRRTLMYTYAFAFYLEQKNAQTKIFEDNQQDLEVATEQLSEYMERTMEEEEDLAGLKQKVQDKMHYVERRQQVLLQHCVEGTERREWQYNRGDIQKEDGTIREVPESNNKLEEVEAQSQDL